MIPNQVDYTAEGSDKKLGLADLVECITEYVHYSINHDSEYLKLRIALLLAEFDIDFKWPTNGERREFSVLENLIYGENILPTKILPFDSYVFLEGPPLSRHDVHSFFQVRRDQKNLYDQTRSQFIELQKLYLVIFFQRLVPLELQFKEIELKNLVARGLPVKEIIPTWDEF